ncbi:MAG: hypothetical protein WBG58_08490, partial [Ignavibacteriaceae bacterium]
MAECSFKFNIDSSPTEIIDKVKTKIEKERGSFTGNENDGNFNLSSPVGAIEGNYSISGNELKIDITKKPMMLPCSMIESELEKRLK